MENEIWKEIKGAKYYQVSNLGRVKSLKRKSGRGGKCSEDKILKPAISGTGKLMVYIVTGLRGMTINVSTLVFEAFIHEKKDRKQICYIDSDPLNCKVDNLTLDRKYYKRVTKKTEKYKGLPEEWEKEFMKLARNTRLTRIDLQERFDMPSLEVVDDTIHYLDSKNKGTRSCYVSRNVFKKIECNEFTSLSSSLDNAINSIRLKQEGELV